MFGSATAPLRAIESRSGRHVLICSVHAIRIAVADPLLGNALRFTPLLVGAAREFRFGVALARSALMALVLIRIVKAVVIAVADINSRNTVSVIARKQVTEAGLCARFAVIGRLVGSVSAIVIAVAVPSGGNAPVVVGTSETVGGTRALRAGGVVLIGVVATIVIAIAEPKRFDANVG